MPKKIALDANFVLALVNTEEYSKKVEEIYKLIEANKITAYAPIFLLVEVLNILIKKKKVDPELTKKTLERLKKSQIIFLNTDILIKNSSLLEDLVAKYGVTSYDAIYLLTAIKSKCKLLTADQELLKVSELTISLI